MKGEKYINRVSGRVFFVASASLMALLSLFFASCTKYTVECELVVQPYVKITQGSGDNTPAYLARAYVYYIEEKEFLNPNWRPESYADADAGIIRHRTTGEIRSHGLMAGQGEDGFVRITVTSSPMLLVAVDPVNKFYAYRTFQYKIPLERILIPVTFKIYQGTQPYKETDGWTYAGEQNGDTPQE